MTHAKAPDPDEQEQEEAIHIVVYANGSLDCYIHPDKVSYFALDGTPFDPALLAARIEKLLRDIAQAEQSKN